MTRHHLLFAGLGSALLMAVSTIAFSPQTARSIPVCTGDNPPPGHKGVCQRRRFDH